MMLPSWIGWVALVVVVAAFVYLLRKQIKQRKDERANPVSWSVYGYKRFPYTTIPIDVSRERGYEIIARLNDIFEELWPELIRAYDETPKGYGFVTLHLIHGVPHPQHPHIVYHQGPGIITAKIEPQLPIYWAGELHNAFRYVIGAGKDERLMPAKKIQWFIEENYYG